MGFIEKLHRIALRACTSTRPTRLAMTEMAALRSAHRATPTPQMSRYAAACCLYSLANWNYGNLAIAETRVKQELILLGNFGSNGFGQSKSIDAAGVLRDVKDPRSSSILVKGFPNGARARETWRAMHDKSGHDLRKIGHRVPTKKEWAYDSRARAGRKTDRRLRAKS